jgi:3-phenylpropionate/cinnamic acid dioxygenase small subunit
MAGPPAAAAVQYEVEQFLYGEARMLDERRFADWLALFTDDASYSMPLGDPDPRLEVSEADRATLGLPTGDYDKPFLALVVQRLETQQTHAERPPSITRHLITNVQAAPADDSEEVNVHSCFAVFQTRPGRFEQTFYGERADRLRRVDGQWRIARRRVMLDHSPLPRAISILF